MSGVFAGQRDDGIGEGRLLRGVRSQKLRDYLE
jgi:hypothetical protein